MSPARRTPTGWKTAVLAAAAVLLLTPAVSAGWWDDVADAEQVDLADVIANPRKYKGKEISFTCTFHEITQFYNPYYTRFVPSEYVNFAVWPTGKEIWEEGEYLDSFAFLFLERDHKLFTALTDLERFTSLKLRGYVLSTFKSVPWIEIRHLEVVGESFTVDTLKHIIRGDKAEDAGRPAKALHHYDLAAESNPPDEIVLSIERKRAGVLTALGREREARVALDRALEIRPGDPEAGSLLAQMRRLTPPPAALEPRTPEGPAYPPAAALEPGARAVAVEAAPEPEPRAHVPPPAGVVDPAMRETPERAPRVTPRETPSEPKPTKRAVPRKRFSGPM